MFGGSQTWGFLARFAFVDHCMNSISTTGILSLDVSVH